MFSPAPASYVDGILKLHAQIDEACKTAYILVSILQI